MGLYMLKMMIMYYCVNYLLLLGTNRLLGYEYRWYRLMIASLYGSVFAVLCLLPYLSLIGSVPFRILSLFVVGALAFGLSFSGLKKCAVYFLLHMALHGITGVSSDYVMRFSTIAAIVIFVCCTILSKRSGLYVPVELYYAGRKLTLTALRDTGHSLRDPITGRSVLIVDALTAEGLTGLSRQQLQKPLETMGTVPGMRLIPYKTIGGTGLMLALWLTDMKIGSQQRSGLVAFSPEVLSTDGVYQALFGGGF